MTETLLNINKITVMSLTVLWYWDFILFIYVLMVVGGAGRCEPVFAQWGT